MEEYKVVNQLNHFIESCYCVPLAALRMSVRRKISGLIESDFKNGFDTLANMVGFDVADINIFQKQRIPTIELLHAWTYRADLRPTVDVFLQLLLKMKRLDVLTSCMHVIARDVQRYRKDQQTESYGLNFENKQTDQHDAYVIYNQLHSSDSKFVKDELIPVLEGQYGLKLFIPDRDDLSGESRSTYVTETIEHRCRHVLIVLSQRLNPDAEFQLKFAQCLSTESTQKKIIPICIEPCDVPNIIKHVICSDFTVPDTFDNRWLNLAKAIQLPVTSSSVLENITIDQVKRIPIRTSDDDMCLNHSTKL